MSTLLSLAAFLTIQALLLRLTMGRLEPARDVQDDWEKDFSWISSRSA